MIRIICGPKGTGKTKIILDEVDSSVKVAKGDVVFITDKKINSAKIDFKVRCLYAEEFNINNADSLRGYINGLVAGNSDIEYLFIDGVMRVIKSDEKGLENFFNDVLRLEKEYGLKVTMTISIAKENLPSYLAEYAD
ncbi:MAG: hypothetical protein ACI4M6_06150 [Christensenellaceae bacterium]